MQLTGPHSPTVDIYFGFAFADWIASGHIEWIAPTVLRSGSTLIVFRHTSGTWPLPNHDRLILVMDDDWRAAFRDTHIPLLYRAKLLLVEGRRGPNLERRADHILVPSSALEKLYRRLYPAKDITRIPPHWPSPDALSSAQADRLVVAYLSAQSHAKDFRFVRPVIDEILGDPNGPDILITANQRLPSRWKASPRVQVAPRMSWGDYRGWMQDKRIDIALYPLLEGRFASSRSPNKFMEFDQFGASIIASRHWVETTDFATQSACLSLDNTHDAWRKGVGSLIKDSALRQSLARQNRQAIDALNARSQQRAVWSKLLAIQ